MVLVRRFAALSVALGLAGAAASPASAQTTAPAQPTPQDQVVLSGRVLVPRGQAVGEIVVFRGRVTVLGVARGDVVVLSGGATIAGQVGGSVIVVTGTVRLSETAQVAGDVIGGGDVIVAPGASVTGTVRQHVSFTLDAQLGAIGRFLTWLAVTVSTLLLGFVLLLLAPKGADAIHLAIRSAPWACAGWGLAALAGIPALSAVAAVTLVGLPLAIVVLLAFALLLFVGYAWAAWILGRALVREPRGRVVAFLAGWGLLRVVGLIPVVSGISWGIAAVAGLGAMTVATWRARGASERGGKHREGAAAR